MTRICKILSSFTLTIALLCISSSIVNGQKPTVKDVYFCGHIGEVATYWKNGKVTYLTDGKNRAFATAIKVIGDDIYVAGIEFKDYLPVAKYWKNEIATSLTDGSSDVFVNDIIIVGNDIYVVGYENYHSISVATYWKNGVATYLTDRKVNTDATALVIIGNDIYVALTERESSGLSVAKYWKNGVVTTLKNDNTYSSTYATSMTVSDDNVYIVGYEFHGPGFVAKYWKNSVAISLTDGKNSATAKAIIDLFPI